MKAIVIRLEKSSMGDDLGVHAVPPMVGEGPDGTFGLEWRTTVGRLAPFAQIYLLSAVMTLSLNVNAQGRAHPCGPIYIVGAFGPYDYRTDQDKLSIVENTHFTPKVEQLISGKTASLGGDIGYTLRKFPNHHRALVAMMRLAKRMKTSTPNRATYSIECYFDRALRFAPNDTVVRMIYATFLADSNREDHAVAQLELAARDAGDFAFTHYNLGRVYMDLKRYDKALKHAHRAIALGFPRQDLATALKQVGKWKEPRVGIMRPASEAALPTDKN